MNIDSKEIVAFISDQGALAERVTNLKESHDKEVVQNKDNFKKIESLLTQGFMSTKASILQDVDARKKATDDAYEKLSNLVDKIDEHIDNIAASQIKLTNDLSWIKKAGYGMWGAICLIASKVWGII
jgi:SMC interacting uncharacterized protein involved in chromosome segregation